MTERDFFKNVGIKLAARKLLTDYVKARVAGDNVGAEGFAEDWMESNIEGDTLIKNQIFSEFMTALSEKVRSS